MARRAALMYETDSVAENLTVYERGRSSRVCYWDDTTYTMTLR